MKSLKIGKSNEVVQLNIGGQIFRLVEETPSTPATKNPVYQNRAERAWIKIYTDKAKAALKSGRTKIGAHYVTKANEQASRLGQPLPFVRVEAVKPAPVAPVVTLDAIEAIRRDIAALRATRPSVQPAQTEKKVAHSVRVLSRKDRKAIKKMKRHGRKTA